MNIFIARSRASILSSILSLSRKNKFPFCDKIESTSLSLYSRRLVKSSSDIIAYLIFFPKKTFSKKRLNSVRSKSPMMKMSTKIYNCFRNRDEIKRFSSFKKLFEWRQNIVCLQKHFRNFWINSRIFVEHIIFFLVFFVGFEKAKRF